MVKKDKTVSNRLTRDKNTRSDYKIILEGNGPLSKKNKRHLKDIFLIALAYGVLKKTKVPIINRDPFINSDNFGDNLSSLINALAINHSDEGVEILSEDSIKVFDVAERYANGGFETLKSVYLGNEDNFIEELRFEIINLNKDDRILNKVKELNF